MPGLAGLLVESQQMDILLQIRLTLWALQGQGCIKLYLSLPCSKNYRCTYFGHAVLQVENKGLQSCLQKN